MPEAPVDKHSNLAGSKDDVGLDSYTFAEPKQKITLTVSENPNGFPMPDARNRGCTDGKNFLAGMGFNVQIDSPIGENGWVRDQDPQPGTPVQQGQQVIIRCNV